MSIMSSTKRPAFKSKVVRGPQLALPITPSDRAGRATPKLRPVRVVRDHQVEIESRRGRHPAPVLSRWTCSVCHVGGDWTTTAAAHDGADAHVKRDLR